MIAVIVHSIEIVALVDPTHKVKRAATCAVGFADVVVVAVGIFSVFEIGLSDWNLADAPTGTVVPWGPLQTLTFYLIIAVV